MAEHIAREPEQSDDGWSYCESCGRLTRVARLRRRTIKLATRRDGTTIDLFLGPTCARNFDTHPAHLGAADGEEDGA